MRSLKTNKKEINAKLAINTLNIKGLKISLRAIKPSLLKYILKITTLIIAEMELAIAKPKWPNSKYKANK